MEILCDAKRKSPLRLSLWLDCPGWWQKMKVGCGEEGRGSLDILPAVNLPTSKKQSRTNSQCNREAILTFRFHILEFFFFNPSPSLPKEPTPLVSIPWVSFSCFDLYKTELLQYILCAACLPWWDLHSSVQWTMSFIPAA